MTQKIKIKGKLVFVDVFLIEKDEVKDFSRVYVVVRNSDNKIALIYNSKRDVWGFPGGHSEEGESVYDTAMRECVEEIGFSIKNCESKYVLLNKLDNGEEKMQIICFAEIDKESKKFVDENESVSCVKFVDIKNIQEEMGNFDLWEGILQEYKKWRVN